MIGVKKMKKKIKRLVFFLQNLQTLKKIKVGLYHIKKNKVLLCLNF